MQETKQSMCLLLPNTHPESKINTQEQNNNNESKETKVLVSIKYCLLKYFGKCTLRCKR